MKQILFFIFFVFCFQLIEAQDIIYKKDDKIIAGKVISVDSAVVVFKEISAPKDQTISISLSDIKEIKFDYSNSKFQTKTNSDYVRAKNAVSIGIGGTGGIFSINYDRAIFETDNFFLSAKVGIGSWLSQTNINAHITSNFNFGSNMHYLEFGLGGAAALGQFNKYFRYYASLPIIGYRLQPKSESFFFRVYACTFGLIKDSSNDSIFVPMLSIDLGFCF
jgi:hypothetical protein